MSRDEPRIGRLEALLADRALQGLAGPERAELARLVADADPDAEPDGLALELAAAEADLAMLGLPAGAPPGPLRARLEVDAAAFFARVDGLGPRRSMVARAWPWLGWAAAAAALLLRPAWTQPPPASNPAGPAPRSGLVDRLAGVEPRPLSGTDHPLARGGGGRLLWSGERQEGYLELRGLAEVEPGKGVYQLWIFDATRDDRFPVDGGTFAVEDAARTTMVPIRPGLVVRRPTLFAVTLEPPGGVVVSDRKRILLTAASRRADRNPFDGPDRPWYNRGRSRPAPESAG